MTEENGHILRVTLYERMSARRQAEQGCSLGGQLHKLRERMEAESQ